jgi:hypothetical protein
MFFAYFFQKRRPFYSEQGDVHGRVDHAGLGTSMRAVAYCLEQEGQAEAAEIWRDRAKNLPQ